MNEIYSNPLFGIALSIGAYKLATIIYTRFKLAILNPLLMAIIFSSAVICIFHIPIKSYYSGGSVISMFLAPATCVLSVNIFKQITLLKKNVIPILAGSFIGSFSSIASIILLCNLFGLDKAVTSSFIPKSVTTPIALELSQKLGGIPSLTMAALIITGILGSLLCPPLIKLLHIDNKIAAGLAIGTCSHAIGTSKAIELGEVEGAISSIAISIAGLFTVLICFIFI